VTTPTVKLTAYNQGPSATEKDFDDWAIYVANNIEKACGFAVDVEQFAFTGKGQGGTDDVILDATDEQEEAIEEALRSLWESGCAEDFKVEP